MFAHGRGLEPAHRLRYTPCAAPAVIETQRQPIDDERGLAMTGSLSALATAVVLFIASHLGLSMPKLRQALVGRLGERGFRAVYSLISLALLVWVAMAYGTRRSRMSGCRRSG